MYTIEVLSQKTHTFEIFKTAGRFARRERAEGAMIVLERMGEKRPMRVAGAGSNSGRTERQAARQPTQPPPVAKNDKKRSIPAPSAEVKLSKEQVADLVASIRPTEPESGEYILDLEQLKKATGT